MFQLKTFSNIFPVEQLACTYRIKRTMYCTCKTNKYMCGDMYIYGDMYMYGYVYMYCTHKDGRTCNEVNKYITFRFYYMYMYVSIHKYMYIKLIL